MENFEAVPKGFCGDGIRQAAHVLIFTRTAAKLWDEHEQRAYVNMHMRFDGKLGFPGGLIDAGEDTETGLNRETKEELGIELGIAEADWISTHFSKQHKIVNHFYCKEVTEKMFLELEKKSFGAEEFGVEILGHIRIPLYTYKSSRGRLSGFPQFLKHNFAGNAREQMLKCLELKNILTTEEISEALKLSECNQS